jgi:hypothetical protein
VSLIRTSEPAEGIAATLIAMHDQSKLRRITELLNMHIDQLDEKPHRRNEFDKLFEELDKHPETAGRGTYKAAT